MKRARTLLAAALAAGAMLASGAAPAVADSHQAVASHGRSQRGAEHGKPVYSLALGDSLAYGYQQALFNSEVASGSYDPAAFVGYNGRLRGPLSGLAHRHVVVVNYGCPGETTQSFTVACEFTTATSTHPAAPVSWLHDPYTGSQLAAALAFLSSHQGHVADVTIDLGSNDLLAALRTCVGASQETCASNAATAGQTVVSRLAVFVTQIEAADPGVPVVMSNFYNPEVADSRLSAALAPLSDALAKQVNAGLAAAIAGLAAQGVPVAVADAFTAINVPHPQFSSETAQVCALTSICTPLFDIHPTDAGYQQLERAFLAALQPLLGRAD